MRRASIVPLVLLPLALAGCGGGDTGSDPAQTSQPSSATSSADPLAGTQQQLDSVLQASNATSVTRVSLFNKQGIMDVQVVANHKVSTWTPGRDGQAAQPTENVQSLVPVGLAPASDVSVQPLIDAASKACSDGWTGQVIFYQQRQQVPRGAPPRASRSPVGGAPTPPSRASCWTASRPPPSATSAPRKASPRSWSRQQRWHRRGSAGSC